MNLRTGILFFLLSLTALSCREQAKDFEGVIYYRHYFSSCSPRYPLDVLFMNFDTASEYYYKNGNYKWTNKNAMLREDMYLESENRNYFRVGGGEGDVYFGEGAEVDEVILTYSEKKNQGNILGYDCDMLSLATRKIKDKSLVYTNLLYSPKITIDSTAFSKLKYLSHDFITSKIHSLPLRIEMYGSDFEIVMEATRVEFRTLDDSLFTIVGKDDAIPLNRLSF